MEERKIWNTLADQYQEVIHAYNDGYTQRLLAFLTKHQALIPGQRVADIGCGVGKNALRFAELGCGLLLVDIADRMMDYAVKNLAGFSVPLEAAVCDWAQVDIEEKGWARCCDLAFAAMTPALRTDVGLEKFCGISKKFCFASTFFSMDNQLFRQVSAACDLSVAEKNPGGPAPFELLHRIADMGYFPLAQVVAYNWENIHSIDETERRILNGDLGQAILAEGKQAQLRQALRVAADGDSLVRETVRAKVIWILWDVTEKEG